MSVVQPSKKKSCTNGSAAIECGGEEMAIYPVKSSRTFDGELARLRHEGRDVVVEVEECRQKESKGKSEEDESDGEFL